MEKVIKKQLAEKAARRLHGIKTGPLNVRTIAPMDPSNRLLRGIEGVKKPMMAKKNRGERMLDRAVKVVK